MTYAFCIAGVITYPQHLAEIQLELCLFHGGNSYQIFDHFTVPPNDDQTFEYAYSTVRRVTVTEYLGVLSKIWGQQVTPDMYNIPKDVEYYCYLFEIVYEKTTEAVRFRTLDAHVPVREIA